MNATVTKVRLLALWLLGGSLFAGPAPVLSADDGVTVYRYRVVEQFPHATDVFTQGLVYRDGLLYESAGQYGESRLLTRTLTDTTPIRETSLPPDLFAEGIAVVGDRLFQLTWRSGRGFVYRRDTLEPLREFRLRGQGWGMAYDGERLIVSNGSSELQFLDPDTLETVKTLTVTRRDRPVAQLNELEWIDGLIYANVWRTDLIVMIDPDSGRIRGEVNLEQLLPSVLRRARTGVLNGIAYDAAGQRLLVTGKYWPRLYHIELQPPATAKP